MKLLNNIFRTGWHIPYRLTSLWILIISPPIYVIRNVSGNYKKQTDDYTYFVSIKLIKTTLNEKHIYFILS